MRRNNGSTVIKSLLAASASAGLLLAFASASQAQTFTIFAGTAAGSIYTIQVNQATNSGTVTNVFHTAFTGGINGLAWNQTNQSLYFANSNFPTVPGGNASLEVWTPSTGSGGAVTALTLSGAGSGLLPGVADNGSIYNGSYWYLDGNGNTTNFWQVNLSSGVVSQVTTNSITAFYDTGDIAVNPNTGALYGVGTNVGSGGTGSTNELFTGAINSSTPAVTGYTVVNGSVGNTSATDYQTALSVDGKTLYLAGISNFYSVSTSALPTSGSMQSNPMTLTFTNGITSFDGTITDLSSVGATPTPPAWLSTLIGMSVACGLVVVQQSRRRRRRIVSPPA